MKKYCYYGVEVILCDNDFEWFATRIDTTTAGVIFFSNHAVNKFIKICDLQHLDRRIVRDVMCEIFQDYA